MAKIETSLTAAQVAIAEALFAETYAVTVGKREGNEVNIPVPMAEFPANVWAYIVRYGVQRTFNDKVGGADTKAEEKAKLVRERIGEYKEGKVAKARASASGMTEERRALYAALKDALDTESRKAINKLEDDAQHAELDKLFNGLNDAQKGAIAKLQAAKIAAWEAARAAKADAKATVSGLKIAL